MRERVPGVQQVDAEETIDGRVVLRFQDGSFKDPFSAPYVSDGTIKMFAYLVLLYDPQPHPLLSIEEPENQLYPDLLPELAEELRDYAWRGGGQILVSTHSPELLDAAEVDEVFSLSKKSGCTRIHRAADDEQIVALVDAGDPMGALWRQGFFQGHLTDQGLRPMDLVFLLEESSACHVLKALLPNILPTGIPHTGKSDLQQSIPRKLRNWRTPDTRFVVLHDQDANQCVDLKQALTAICRRSGRDDTLVRIACYELEAWYFGDLEAVRTAYPKFKAAKYAEKSKYRQPDTIVKPSRELERLVPEFQKGSASRSIPKHMVIERNRSPSFRIFVEGLRELCNRVVPLDNFMIYKDIISLERPD